MLLAYLTSCVLAISTSFLASTNEPSGEKHIEEMKGYSTVLPASNQIEVSQHLSFTFNSAYAY